MACCRMNFKVILPAPVPCASFVGIRLVVQPFFSVSGGLVRKITFPVSIFFQLDFGAVLGLQGLGSVQVVLESCGIQRDGSSNTSEVQK